MAEPQSHPTGRFQRALVALHNTEQDASLLAYVQMLVRMGIVSELVFVHVASTAENPDELERAAREMKSTCTRSLESVSGLSRVTYDVRNGNLLDQLLEAVPQHQADVVLVGHRQDHALRRSLARRLAKLTPCSVWLVPDGVAPTVTRVLVPVDFSPAAGHALGVAVGLAPRFGITEVTTVHVYFDESRTTYEGADVAIRGREAEAFATFAAPFASSGIEITPLFRESVHPANAIHEVTNELGADLVVMGTRGRTPSAAILLGSVAQETLIGSRVPVLIVKAPGQQVGLFRALLERLSQHEPGVQFD